MFNNFSKSIFIRILFPVFAALLIGVVCILTGSYIIEKESLNKLKYLSENQAHGLENYIETLEKTADDLSYIISNTADIKKTKGDSFYNVDSVEQLESVIKKYSNRYNDIIGISFYLFPEYSFDKKQNTYFYAKSSLKGVLEKQKVEKNEEIYLKNICINFQNDYKGLWNEPFVDKFSGLYAISYEKPIILNNKIIGISKVNISLNEIVKFLADIKTYNEGHAFLLDKKYHVITCSTHKTTNIIENNNKLLLNLVPDAIEKENNEIISYKNQNIKMIASFNHLEDGFIYVVNAPKNEVFEQKYHLQRMIIGIIFMGLFAVILILLNI